jgi:hypothetical protein
MFIPSCPKKLPKKSQGTTVPITAQIEPLTILFRHIRWANLRILERCAGLTSEQLDATMVGTEVNDVLSIGNE